MEVSTYKGQCRQEIKDERGTRTIKLVEVNMKDNVDKMRKMRKGQERQDIGGKYKGQGKQETKDERGTRKIR